MGCLKGNGHDMPLICLGRVHQMMKVHHATFKVFQILAISVFHPLGIFRLLKSFKGSIDCRYMAMFPKIMVPQNGGFIMVPTLLKWDDFPKM